MIAWILFVLGLSALAVYLGALDKLVAYLHRRNRRLRRKQRPSRIFLIRHGQSQANVDTSNKTSLGPFI